VFRSFDEMYGTDTAGCITLDNLQIQSANREHGHPYEPIPIMAFENLLNNLKVQHNDYVFLDLGSGKGRALLLASNYPFKKVIGVEYALDLHIAALKNIDRYRSPRQRCADVQSVHIDAAEYLPPLESTVCFLFHPFGEKVMRTVLTKFKQSLDRHPRDVKFIFYIPQHVHLFDELGFCKDQLLLHQATLRDIKESAADRAVVR
jgi:SAM-dependent methyltransferase